MQQPSTQTIQRGDNPLPVARLLFALSPGDQRERVDVVELDRREAMTAAKASTALSRAGWELSLLIDGTSVELVAEKRQPGIGAATAELVALGVRTGVLYLDTPTRDATTHEVIMDTPHQVLHLSNGERDSGLGSQTGQALVDLDVQMRVGALFAAHVPAGTDAERLLAGLQDSGLGDAAAAAVAAAAADAR